MDINEQLNNFVKDLRSNNSEEIKTDVNEIMQYYSFRISEAINPINMISLPFLYHLLVNYANEIENHFPGTANSAKCFENCEKMTIVVPKKDN